MPVLLPEYGPDLEYLLLQYSKETEEIGLHSFAYKTKAAKS